MKKITLITLATLVALASLAFVITKNKKAAPTPAATESKAWFNTIAITDGITVEFEYGNQLEVFVEGEPVSKLALVLDKNVLKASVEHSLPNQQVKIKVVTPVLISLARQPGNTPARCKNESCKSSVKPLSLIPVLARPKFFKASEQNA